jgi:phosphate transport system substrate-binding protein
MSLAGCAPAPPPVSIDVPPGIECATGTIKAAGSTAQANAISDWIVVYQTGCPDATIDYQAVGSGAGIEQFVAGQTSFAGTDSAADEEERAAASERCNGGAAVNIPLVGGGIGIVYHLDGVDELVLDPPTVAGIFANEITRWNDPALVRINPDVTLPDAAIAQFHRSDASGTTANFTGYLADAAPESWPFEPGKEWIAPGGQGAKGSDQVIASVDVTPNSIGYVDLSYVDVAVNARGALLDTGSGPVAPTPANASAMIAAAEISGDDGNTELAFDYADPPAGAYPIVLVTYELACSSGLADSFNPELVASFLQYAASDPGQATLAAGGYAPITGDLLVRIREIIQGMSP